MGNPETIFKRIVHWSLVALACVFAVVAAIVIFGFHHGCTILPLIKKNQEPVLGAVIAFASAALEYRETTGEQYVWDEGETKFKDVNGKVLFNHISPKRGYLYKYYSNSPATGKGKATKFVYLAYPVSLKCGRMAYYVGESSRVFEVETKSEETLAKFEEARPDFGVSAGNNRFAPHGLEFIRK